MQSSVSSKTGSQYLVLCTPSAYAFANLLSVCSAMMATENCVMGCVCFGSEASTSKTCCGTCARDRSSADRPSTCAFVGTSPVSRSHSRPSGRGSPPLTAAGKPFLQVGDGVSTKPDALLRVQQRGLPDHAGMPRMPPIAMFTVTSPRDLSPCACLIFFRRSCCAGIARRAPPLIPARRRGVPSPGAAQKVAVGAAVVDAWAVRPETAETMRRMALVTTWCVRRDVRRPRARVWACASVDRRYFPKVRFWLFRTCRRRSGCQRKKCFSDPRGESEGITLRALCGLARGSDRGDGLRRGRSLRSLPRRTTGAMSKHHPDLIMCRKLPGIAIGRLCERCDGQCVNCDSFVRPATLVRVCDECNYNSNQGRCVICGGVGVADTRTTARSARRWKRTGTGAPRSSTWGAPRRTSSTRKKYGFKR